MQRTYMAKPAEVVRTWYVVDAEGKTLGRLASDVAKVLRGKHKPTFTPHLDVGDNVIVINAAKVALTGDKWKEKKYQWHTGYLGGLKERTAAEMRDRRPERMVELAVKGMLPKNRLGRQMYRKLYVYEGAEHPHAAQKPVPLEVKA